MDNTSRKSIGLFGKVIVLILLPTYVIIGLISYFYIKDTRATFDEAILYNARTSVERIQERLPYSTILNNPTQADYILMDFVAMVPAYNKITIYAEQEGLAKIIASSEPGDTLNHGDPEDLLPLQTGRWSLVHRGTDDAPVVEILAPYIDNNRRVAVIGLYISTIAGNTLVAELKKRVFWITMAGLGLLLILIYLSVRNIFLTPLRLLASGTNALAQGDLNLRLPVRSNDEISRLMESFNTMATSLQTHMDRERDKVRQLGILHESSVQLATDENLATLVKRLVENARLLIRSDLATFYLLDPQTGAIVLFEHSGVDLKQHPIQAPPKGEGLLRVLLKEGTAVLYNDISQAPESVGLPPDHPPVRSLLGIPMILRDKVIGGIAVANKHNGDGYTQEDEDLLSLLAFQAATAVDQIRLLEEAQRQAVTDGLTDLFNHREFQKRLQDELDRCKRYGRDFSLLIIDIDFFKSVNDTYGHPFGDLVLKEVGSLIKEIVRTMDIPARYGGEEFAVIAPETRSENARRLAERLRSAVSAHSFQTSGGQQASLSISIGVASFPLDAQDREGLIQAADQALYFAKEAGRNCVHLYSESLKAKIEQQQGKVTALLTDPSLRGIRDLATAIDAKTPYTRGHSEEVARYAIHLASALGLDEETKENLRIASLLHNIGTVSIPDRILNKPGPFSIEERKIIQAHPMLAGMILEKTARMEEILPAILYHHERFDGKGYPNGLKGEAIPYLARLLSVVEAYHAMLSVRPYRPRLSALEAKEELRRNAGSQFDPAIVEAFLNSL